MLTSVRAAEGGARTTIGGRTFTVLSDDQAAQLVSGARAWEAVPVEVQEGTPEQEFSIPLTSFHDGYGFTFAEIPNVYEASKGWVADAPGQIATWGLHATGALVTDTDSRGWNVYHGGYLYQLRGRYATKYRPSDDDGGTWSVIEHFDFETIANDRQVAGRPRAFQGSLYVPLRNAAGTLQRFIRLTTVSTTVTEVQTIVVSGTPSAGTYTITFDGKTTAALAYNASGATVQAALRLIGGLQDITVSTAGVSPNFTHTVTLTHAPAAAGTTSPPQMTSTLDGAMSGSGGAIAHATTVAGTGDRWDQGPAAKESVAFTVWERKLVRGDGNEVETASTDPLTAGNWGGLSEVGDSGQPITDLAVYGTELIVGKTDGPWSFDTNRDAYPLLPKLLTVTHAQNCIGMEEIDGALLIPHITGLVRWRPGAYVYAGAEQDGRLEGALSPGWGRVASIAGWSHDAYIAINDTVNGEGVIAALHPASARRRPYVPHMSQRVSGTIESLAIAQVTIEPPTLLPLATWTSDNAVGTIAWTNPSNAAQDDASYAEASGAGTTEYLKGLDLNIDLPSGATINGITVTAYRSAGTSDVTVAYTTAGTGANFASVGTNAWTNPGNLTADDGNYATVATAGQSQGLRGSNFGFAIPTNATILGIELAVQRKASVAATATTTAATYAGTGASVGALGAWTNPSRVTADDGSYAFAAGYNPGYNPSATLYATNFGFAIPTDATISGVTVAFKRYNDVGAGGVVDSIVQLTKDGSTLVGTNLSAGASYPYLIANAAYASFGGAAILWGTTWTPAELNASTFGVGIQALLSGYAGGGGYIDAVRVTVDYVTASGRDAQVSLIGDTSTVIGANKAATTTDWTTADVIATYGGAADTWSATLTPAIINSANFGAILSATVPVAGGTLSVDYMQIRVTYRIGDVVDNVVRLVKAGVVVGDNKASADQWSSTPSKAYGGAAELWGTTWTVAEVEANDFGVVISATTVGGAARVQYVTVEVAYTIAGVTDPGSYLVAMVVNAERTGAQPYVYKLARNGQPVANDPNITRKVGRDAISDFATARYYTPGRHVQKTYRVVEFWLDADVTTGPGVQIIAKVEDGSEITLRDADGAALTATESGYYRAWFPATSAAVGRWVQFIARVPVATGAQTAAAYRVRDFIARGSYDAQVDDVVVGYLALDNAPRTGLDSVRPSAKSDKAFLRSLRDPQAAPVSISDPDGNVRYGRLDKVRFKEKTFKDGTGPTYVAEVRLRMTSYGE